VIVRSVRQSVRPTNQTIAESVKNSYKAVRELTE
jgi:hypothetical protein